MQNGKHEFAIYYAGLRESIQGRQLGDVVQITDETIVGRIRNILRLEPNEIVILFDDTHHASVTIVAIQKNSITLKINSVAASSPLQPSIQMLLPILKREAMEDCLAAMCELGVTTIQPVITAKSQRNVDIERALKIMRAAAEQSKQFAIPKILPIITLEDALGKMSKSTLNIFFDVAGESLRNYLGPLDQKSDTSFVCLVGPEGDLTADEKRSVKEAGFTLVKLTPTVLRSWQAAFLGVGIIRSYVRQNELSY